jgi:hypothetical protein
MVMEMLRSLGNRKTLEPVLECNLWMKLQFSYLRWPRRLNSNRSIEPSFFDCHHGALDFTRHIYHDPQLHQSVNKSTLLTIGFLLKPTQYNLNN